MPLTACDNRRSGHVAVKAVVGQQFELCRLRHIRIADVFLMGAFQSENHSGLRTGREIQAP